MVDDVRRREAGDRAARAYNRTSFLSERTTMMQAWADYLDNLKGEMGELKSVAPQRRSA